MGLNQELWFQCACACIRESTGACLSGQTAPYFDAPRTLKVRSLLSALPLPEVRIAALRGAIHMEGKGCVSSGVAVRGRPVTGSDAWKAGGLMMLNLST